MTEILHGFTYIVAEVRRVSGVSGLQIVVLHHVRIIHV